MKEFWLAYEGGGTKTRMILAEPGGKVVAREVCGSASRLYTTPGMYARTAQTRLKRLKRKADEATGKVTAVCMGGPMRADVVAASIRSVFGDVELSHVGEFEIAMAATGVREGVLVVAGTGASVHAVDEQGRHGGFGGLGPQFGDEGSGYWIGREAIAAAMRAHQGRGCSTQLTERLTVHYGIGNIMEILRWCGHSGHVPGPKVAGCVPCVFEAAWAGDTVAREICGAAGQALAELVSVACEQVGIKRRPVPVGLTGGVFNGGELILEPMKAELETVATDFELQPPVPEPVEGMLKILDERRGGA